MQQIPFFKELAFMFSARYPLIYLESSEYERTYQNLRHLAINMDYDLYCWNAVDGLGKQKLNENKVELKAPDMYDMEAVLIEIANRMDSPTHELFVLEDAHNSMEEDAIRIRLRKLAEDLRFAKGKKHVILLSSVRSLPPELEKLTTVLELPLPDRSELERILTKVAQDARTPLDDEVKARMVDAALGMSEFEADQAFSLAWAKSGLGPNAAEIVMREKKQIIKKNGLLEFYEHSESMEGIGGLANLKRWLDKRGTAFSPGARAFHLAEPKGLLMLGIPGCGKSMTAQAISGQWKMPLLRLDIGKLFEGLVGSSEGNMRKAIQTAEAVAPCVLWIDEIEKGLAGIGSGGSTDSGVSSRVFSTLLTWMQEKKKPVFLVATANNIRNLPPELMRKGRFDGIFFVDLPDEEERADIFRIHLQKKGQDPAKFDSKLLASKSKGFNGAEIAECVNEALFSAYSQSPREPKLEIRHLINAIQDTVPLSTTMREDIEELRKWATTRANPAGKVQQNGQPPAPVEIPKERKRVFQ